MLVLVLVLMLMWVFFALSSPLSFLLRGKERGGGEKRVFGGWIRWAFFSFFLVCFLAFLVGWLVGWLRLLLSCFGSST